LAFDLACKRCGGADFALAGNTRRAADGLDETGLIATCVDCGQAELVFDELVHGYDGELGHWSNRGGPAEPTPLQNPVEAEGPLTVNFWFNCPADEIAETSAETGIATEDLFDWITVDRGDQTVWDRECA